MADDNFLYTVNFQVVKPDGTATRTIQIAGGSVSELLKRADEVEAGMMSKGWKPTTATAGAAPVTGNGNSQSAAAPSGSGGPTVKVFKIEVGLSFKEPKKPQLRLHVDGEKRQILVTAKQQGDFASLYTTALQGVKVDGRAFSPADMVNGKSYGGNWIVEYEASGDYKNLVRFVNA